MAANMLGLYAAMFLILTLARHTYTQQTSKEWKGAPPLATFNSYEDMQRYFDNRNFRSLRFIDNPTDDSYLHAYNQHNESPRPIEVAQKREKRNTNRKLPSEPTFFRFEITDAVEPSDEVKELIRKYRSREAKQVEVRTPQQAVQASVETSQQLKAANSGKKDVAKVYLKNNPRAKILRPKIVPGRSKRSALRQPASFQVQLINFEESDAREPNEETKTLIKRMRALDIERSATQSRRNSGSTQTVTSPPKTSTSLPFRPKNIKPRTKSNYKRSRRSAPQMIKFELEDARQMPSESKKNLPPQQKPRASKEMKETTLLTMERNATIERMSTNAKQSADSHESDSDQSSEESKRMYFYKEAPVKAKKSINSLPNDVQKVISQLLKDNRGAKAYVKYIPAQQMNYGHLKSAYGGKLGQPVYGAKLQPASYVKYNTQPLQTSEQVQVQIHPVPVVEKVRYIYHPVVSGASGHGAAGYAHIHQMSQNYVHAPPAIQPVLPQHLAVPGVANTAGMSQPIVVSESEAHGGHQQQYQQQYQHQQQQQHHQQQLQHQPTEIHHTYAAEEAEATQHFRPSKPDPILEENKLAEESAGGESGGGEEEAKAYVGAAAAAEVPIEHYKYELYSHGAHGAHDQVSGYAQSHQHQQAVSAGEGEAAHGGGAAPVIKIEYHAAPDPLKENYKELQEFQELSQLMGKSPEDQIHGLTYLLAKEMQNKLHVQRQQKSEGGERPQDNTAPILFHPRAQHAPQSHQIQPNAGGHQATLGVHGGRFYGMAKSKEYIPIVEGSAEQKGVNGGHGGAAAPGPVKHFAGKQETKAPHPSSFIEYGLSPNYEGGGKGAPKLLDQVVHHPTLTHHGHSSVSVGAHQGLHAAGVKATGGSGYKLGHSHAFGLHSNEDGDDELQYAAKYAFGYRIRDFHTGNDFGHKQNRDLNGVTRGQYHILLPDGRIQNVIYHADDTGFHADVSFETGH